jgi:hypothetical protein
MDAKTARELWIKGCAARNEISMDELLEALRTIDPQKFMTAKERKIFASLPDTFTVYRGYVPAGEDEEDRPSWSLDKEIAERFALAIGIEGCPGCVVERTVRKSDVYAYVEAIGLTNQNEREVIILK